MSETLPILFIVTSLLIILTPGQDMVLVMSRSIASGSKAGVTTAAGISVGLIGHTLLATVGLGALLSSSAVLFKLIKYAGAAYLIYLGVKMFRFSRSTLHPAHVATVSVKKMFCQGMLSNISNPKITLFYFAFLPQFIPLHTPAHAFYIFILGTSFAVLTFLIKAPIGYCAGRLSSWLRAHPSSIMCINRVSGLMLIGLGLRLAAATQDQ